MDTPEEFNFNIQPIYSSEGFLELQLTSSNEYPVNQAVISVMSNGEILAKGISDHEGRFISSIDVEGLTNLDVYSNKSGFVQGYLNVVIEDNNNDLSLEDIDIETANGNEVPALSENINLTLTFKNESNNESDVIQSELVFMDNVSPNTFSLNIPSIARIHPRPCHLLISHVMVLTLAKVY